MSHNYDVILNGCGPVGGIASLLLANRGFKVAVIDLNKSPYPHPRAVGSRKPPLLQFVFENSVASAN